MAEGLEPSRVSREVYVSRKPLGGVVSHWGVMVRQPGLDSGLILEIKGEGGSMGEIIGQALWRGERILTEKWPQNVVILYQGLLGQREGGLLLTLLVCGGVS